MGMAAATGCSHWLQPLVVLGRYSCGVVKPMWTHVDPFLLGSRVDSKLKEYLGMTCKVCSNFEPYSEDTI